MRIPRVLPFLLFGVMALFPLYYYSQEETAMKHTPSPSSVPEPAASPDDASSWNSLSPQEERVIVACGTEPPFTGEYWDHHAPGSYACRRCGALLFPSTAKFDSGTGWPSFDDAYPESVALRSDPDGRRTEIVCATCKGHLGHVFYGERFTDKNTRNCVNSLSLRFIPEKEVKLGWAIFAGGCFWGVEYHFERVPGVLCVVSGYTGGAVEHPTYKQVCDGTTGHAEAVEVTYDPARVSYEALAKLFWEIHDPSQVNRQGPDIGHQYRSAAFYVTEEQKEIANRLIQQLRDSGLKVATDVSPAGVFWPAEAYHQDYYRKTGKTPYCHVRIQRFPPQGKGAAPSP